MTVSEHQDAPTVAFPESDLTRRLLRRAAAPIGVINVRHAAELHFRSRFLQGQRLELLDNLKNRYGLGAGGTAGTAPPAHDMFFVAPLQRLAASGHFDLPSASYLVGRTGMPEPTMGAAQKAPPASSEPQYRVMRPDRHVERNPHGSLSSETVATQSPVAAEIRVSVNSTPTMHLQRKTDETPSPVGGQPDLSASPLVRAAPADSPGYADNKIATGYDGSLIAEPLPHVSELPRISIVAPLDLQRRPDGLAATDEIGPFLTRHDFGPSPAREDFPSYGTSPLGNPSSSGPQLQREANPPPTFPSTHAAQQAETVSAPSAARTNSQSRGPVTAEILAAPLLPDSKSIVWRKADISGASGSAVGPTDTPGAEIMREVASESVLNRGVSPEGTATSESNGVDVPGIAEQVTREIARQLRIERERRGITR